MGVVYVAAQPGLSLSQGTQFLLASETLINIPPGGLDLVARYEMSKSWGFSTAEATSAMIASWVFTTLSKLVLRQQTPIGTVAGVTARIASFMVLLLALRFVGIDDGQLHWTIAFAAFAVTMAPTVIPIFNMPGIAETVLIATFNAAVGGGATDQVAAAVFVYRILTWLTPIPFGGLAFTRWRDQVRAIGKTELLDAFDDADPGSDDAGAEPA